MLLKLVSIHIYDADPRSGHRVDNENKGDGKKTKYDQKLCLEKLVWFIKEVHSVGPIHIKVWFDIVELLKNTDF